MDAKIVLRKSWQIVWHYRALWILAMVLALTAANTIYVGPWQDNQNQPHNSKIKITDSVTIGLPGDGLSIDLTALAGNRVVFTDATGRPFPFLSLTDPSGQVSQSDIEAITIEILILVVFIGLLATIARYLAETAVIRMVSETEGSGKRLKLRQGLRLGWSTRAVRLFLIDLMVGVLGAGIIVFVLWMSISFIMFVEPRGFVAILLTAFGILSLLGITGMLLVVGGILVSLIMQTARRACVMDDLGVFVSIGTGISMLKRHLKDVGITWLIWIAIRILWAPVGVLVILILLPILIFTVLAGMLIGFVPGVLVTGIASLFVNGVTPWIMGLIAGLPILILVTIMPILLVGGWVEIYKSSLWTLTYRELSAREDVVQAAQPHQSLVPAHGVAQ
jgi:hypothetical protein